ncbi:hypothetical protein P1X14_18940 [Sphingomonas sp. AOB5]|nr:hypothetical protein [Sphingomonas sp. AOB5]MDF7777342.1 hypothetical protein [Sphingomonas sp. AOB5]
MTKLFQRYDAYRRARGQNDLATACVFWVFVGLAILPWALIALLVIA